MPVPNLPARGLVGIQVVSVLYSSPIELCKNHDFPMEKFKYVSCLHLDDLVVMCSTVLVILGILMNVVIS